MNYIRELAVRVIVEKGFSPESIAEVFYRSGKRKQHVK
jgi:hypothetical protein